MDMPVDNFMAWHVKDELQHFGVWERCAGFGLRLDLVGPFQHSFRTTFQQVGAVQIRKQTISVFTKHSNSVGRHPLLQR